MRRAVLTRALGQAAPLLLPLAVLLAVGALVLPHLGAGALAGGLDLPWWALAALFAATTTAELRSAARAGRRVPAGEAVALVGLLWAAPTALVAGRLAGTLAAALARRPAWPSVAVTAAGVLAQTALALQVVRGLVEAPADPARPAVWGAGLAAVAASRVVAVLGRELVAPAPDLRRVPRALAHDLARTVPVAAAALLAVLVLAAGAQGAAGGAGDLRWPVLGAGAVLLGALHAHLSTDRRRGVAERLAAFAPVAGSAPDPDALLRRTLLEARELLEVEHVVLELLADEEGEGQASCARLHLDGSLDLRQGATPHPAWLEQAVLVERTETLLARDSTDPHVRAWLHGERVREAVVVPVATALDGVLGMLTAADRRDGEPALGPGDAAVLGRLAAAAATALSAGRHLARLGHQVRHDALTGLPNRVLLRAELERALRAGDAPAVGVLDLDGFKAVNDAFGHALGDALLQEVSRRLLRAVGRDGLVTRLGGDEFALLLHGAPTEAQAVEVGDRVLSALRVPATLGDLVVEVGGSLGLSLAPRHGDDPGTLLKHADVAMYAAKGTSRHLRVYDPALDEDARLVAIAGELPGALSAGLVQVHVLPCAALRDGTVYGAEALLRWDHPALGRIAPQDVVRVAERSGLVIALTAYVLERALRGWASWAEGGARLGVSVNLSARGLLDPGLPAQVGRLLREHAVPASALTLEITEAVVLSDRDAALDALAGLRDLGVRLSLDDFGTGYTSLTDLARLPVDEVKIDREFVAGMRTRPAYAQVVRAIVDLARGLHLDVVAEGVEDARTWDELAALGCTRGQGFHLAHAMPADEVPAWLGRVRVVG